MLTMPMHEIQEAIAASQGICLKCGELQDGVEPDAENYQCEVCDALAVCGIEQALLLGVLSIEE